jgi:SDR family mycofactocin-dependent oxidoreductase
MRRRVGDDLRGIAMVGRVEGKVAVVTGGGRGQGRSHALRLAEEGADIIVIDVCKTPEWSTFDLATSDDLDETVSMVEGLGRRAVRLQADVRDPAALKSGVAAAVESLGRLDVVVANAAVCALGEDLPDEVYFETVSTNLSGVINIFTASMPHLGSGASMMATGSFAGMRPQGVANGPGGMGYSYAKRALAQFVNATALLLGPKSIRVNAIHPTNVDTPLLQNEAMYKVFRPDLERPTKEDALEAFASHQLMPVPWVDSLDVSNTVLFLASDESRYVTGMQMRVDAGALIKAGISGI